MEHILYEYLKSEVWKPYPHNPKYELSTEGRIRRKYSYGYRYLEPIYDGKHIAQAAIKPNNKKTAVGRAVWETFKGPIPEGYMIQYKNGCKSMCDLYNLYLIKTEVLREKTMKMRRNASIKVRSRRVFDKKTGIVYRSIIQASKALYVSPPTVAAKCNDNTQKCCGIEVEWYD